jgi:hypothetical protein
VAAGLVLRPAVLGRTPPTRIPPRAFWYAALRLEPDLVYRHPTLGAFAAAVLEQLAAARGES